MKRIAGVLMLAMSVAAAAQEAKPALKDAEPTCRLTYTLTESDAGKKLGVQHFALTISPASPNGTLKLGSKIPVITGSYNNGAGGASGVQTQFTYLDVGLNLAASLTQMANGYVVNSKMEQSTVSEVPSKAKLGELQDEPVIRQSVLTNTALLVPGKPVVLGSLDTPGSTRHLEIEVVLDVLK